METLALLVQIEKKARRLKQQNERLVANNAALEARIFDYLQQLDEAKASIKLLEDQLKHRSMSEQVVDKQAMQKEIDRYIKIIDQCMAVVNTRE
jgi:hypothetical protein